MPVLSNKALDFQSLPPSAVTEALVQPASSYLLKPPNFHWPAGLRVDDTELAQADTAMVSRPVALKTLSNASVYLTGGRHAVTTSNGDIVSTHRVSENGLAELPWQPHTHLSGLSLLLGNSAGANCYYHWMLDILPKLGYLEKAGVSVSSIDHFLVREIAQEFQIETLMHLGIERSRIVESAEQPYYTCDDLLVLNLDHRINFGMHQFVPRWVNDRFRAAKTTIPTSNPDNGSRIKLYITRAKGVRRSIDNEAELIDALTIEGFTVMAMEALSVREQAALLAQTDTLITAHGGALTNMVFAKPGTRIIELFGTHVYPYYYALANLCQHDYHALLQQPTDAAPLVQLKTALTMGTAENQRISQQANFAVDVEALISCLGS